MSRCNFKVDMKVFESEGVNSSSLDDNRLNLSVASGDDNND